MYYTPYPEDSHRYHYKMFEQVEDKEKWSKTKTFLGLKKLIYDC